GFTLDDLDPVLDQGRLVTKVIYLEDPDQALPFRMSKDQIPVVTLNPTEHPLRVAAALGRPMAIVRLGGRRPTIEEVDGGAGGEPAADGARRWGAGGGAPGAGVGPGGGGRPPPRPGGGRGRPPPGPPPRHARPPRGPRPPPASLMMSPSAMAATGASPPRSA